MVTRIQNSSHINSLTINDIQKIVVEAFCKLDACLLEKLDSNSIYTYQTKDEFIRDHKILFEKLRSNGYKILIGLPSKCLYCYPEANAISFEDADSGVFVIRYVFIKESEGVYRVEKCINRKLPEREDGMPF